MIEVGSKVKTTIRSSTWPYVTSVEGTVKAIRNSRVVLEIEGYGRVDRDFDDLKEVEEEHEPTDDEIYNRPGVEGGIGYTDDQPGSLGENDWRL